MDKILNYQISLFGNFEKIKPNAEIVKKAVPILGDFFPGSITMASIEVTTNNLKYDNRLQFISNDRTILINFLVERIDIVFNPNMNQKSTIDKISKTLIPVISNLKQIFPEIQGYRLATSCNFLSDTMSPEQIAQTIKKHSKPDFFLEGSLLTEWGQRFNSQSNEVFGEYEEFTNHIIAMELNLNNPNQILITLDINTVPLNQSERFDFTALENFASMGYERIINYINKFEND